jgi:hypothetical protein
LSNSTLSNVGTGMGILWARVGLGKYIYWAWAFSGLADYLVKSGLGFEKTKSLAHRPSLNNPGTNWVSCSYMHACVHTFLTSRSWSKAVEIESKYVYQCTYMCLSIICVH